MRKEYLVVDGYNIIYAWDELKELSKLNLESARMKLLDMLSNYQGFKKITVIVVFDAYLVKGGVGSEFKYHNIYVVFTKEAETADHFIERFVKGLGKDSIIKVATSDQLEQIIISGKGAVRMSARELLKEIKETEKQIRQEFIENRPPKNNLLMDNLDDEAKKWMEDMRLNKK